MTRDRGREVAAIVSGLLERARAEEGSRQEERGVSVTSLEDAGRSEVSRRLGVS